MIYDGILAKLLGIDLKLMEQALGKQLGRKAKAVTLNQGALKAGWDYAEATFTKQDPFVIEPMNETAGKILIEGNAAAAIGCMMAGVTVVAWYPITPSSSLCESLIGYMKQYRMDKATGKATFAIVQAEDEIASLGMVIGAGWAGARAMTATAGPGISLMSEFTGLAYYAETPAVIFDVQRVGPSTGLPTRTAQGDLLFTAFLSHGDTKHVMIIPSSVEECYEMAQQAFDLTEQLQTPVFVMMDLDLGMNNWMSEGFKYPEKPINRGKMLTKEVLTRARRVGPLQGRRRRRHPVPHGAGDGMPAYFTRGSGHNAKGQYSERPDDYVDNMDRLSRKFETARAYVPKPVIDQVRGSEDRADRLRHLALGDHREPRSAARGDRRQDVVLPAARLSVHRRAHGVHRRARTRLRRRAEPRRADAAADAARADAGAPAPSCAASSTTTACRSTPEASPTTCWRRKGSRWRRRPWRRSAPARRAENRISKFTIYNFKLIERTYMATPLKVNRIGLEPQVYKGGKTTLCAGCGHNAISERIIDAFYEMGVNPSQVVKLSGIGCSSKSPAYFLGGSHGFNAVHGRMPSVGTGAMLANHKLIAIGISGDGDTGAIGIGQFVHLMRRNLPIIYIIEDNGCYGLTKGQFSPTADLGSKLKNGVVNDLPPIDTCALAIELGATFVARSFSGDKKQLLSLLKAALAHRGTVMLDVISPCVTFNDHEGSTKSYAYAKDHDDPLEEVSFVPFFEDISVDYEPGSTQEVTMHDGSRLYLKKLEEAYDATDKIGALKRLHETARRGEFATGLIYIEPDRDDFLTQLNVVDEPLASLPLERTRPGREALEEIMESLR